MSGTLSPFDLLLLPPQEQAVLRCLVREPRLGLSEIAQQISHTIKEVRETLDAMLSQQRIVEQLRHGRRVFSVRLEVGKNRVRNMPTDVVSLWQPPIQTLLTENRLTENLSAETLTHLTQSATLRPMQVDEVFAWQGESVHHVALVRAGLLKRVRIQGRSQTASNGYLRRGDWVGLSEALGAQEHDDTLTAATDCQLLVWRIEDLLPILHQNGTFSAAICKLFGEQLHACRRQRETSKVWAVDGLSWKAQASQVAAQLAITAAAQEDSVVLWQVAESGAERERLGAVNPTESVHGTTWETAHQVSLFVATPQDEYPPAVYLDLLLAHLRQRYSLVICDVGCANARWTHHLRGQAQTLLTVTDSPTEREACETHWKSLQPFALPKQQRMAVLYSTGVEDLRFHFHISADATESYAELYRRLSLSHTIAIFVPSTQAVDTVTDNTAQVQSTLSFLGEVFGGATSAPADGVWNSEEHGLVTEVVTVVRTFVSHRALETHLDSVVEFATQLKTTMQQEAVAIDVDNQLILV